MLKRISALLAISILGLTLYFQFARLAAAKSAGDVTLSGTVKSDDGKALRGAVVTAASGNKTISRFTDASGRYTIPGLTPGGYNVSATAWGYERKVDTKDLSGKVELSFALAQQWQPARQLSSAQWYASFPVNADTTKLEFQCMGCHNASNLVRHRGSAADQWQSIVTPMGTDVLNDGEMAAARKNALENVSILTKYFGPNASAPSKDHVVAPEISDAVLRATFREYSTPQASTYVHSLTVDPVAEQVYFTEIDRATNGIGQLDIKSEKITEHRFSSDFSQPHNAVVTPDGKVWVSLNNAHQVGMYDPKTGQVAEYPAVAVGHTIDVDWKGVIWESGPGAFKFDPRTKQSKQYFLPKPPDGTVAPGKYIDIMALSAAPASGEVCGTYDLAVGKGNDVWFTCPNPGYVGRLDSETSKIRMFRIPNAGAMKGIIVDPSGNVWFSSFSDHKLGRIDAKTEEVKLYQPPTAHAGLYGILVDRNTGLLWMSDYEGSHITRFNPKTEEFTEYPLPRNDGMPRFMGQDAEGRIWYTEWRGKIGVLDPGDLPADHQVAKIVRDTRQ